MAEEAIKGTPVAEGMIQQWADEAEVGYDVEKIPIRIASGSALRRHLPCHVEYHFLVDGHSVSCR